MTQQDQSPDFIPYVPDQGEQQEAPINPRVPPPNPEALQALYGPMTPGTVPPSGALGNVVGKPGAIVNPTGEEEKTSQILLGTMPPPEEPEMALKPFPFAVAGPKPPVSDVTLSYKAPEAPGSLGGVESLTPAPKQLPTLPQTEEQQQTFEDVVDKAIQANPKVFEDDEATQDLGKELADAMGWKAAPKEPEDIRDLIQKVMEGLAPPEQKEVSVPELRDLGASKEAGALGDVQQQAREELETNLGIGQQQNIALGQAAEAKRKEQARRKKK